METNRNDPTQRQDLHDDDPGVGADGEHDTAGQREKTGRPTRRRVIQGIAVGAAAAGAVYIKPSFRSIGVPVALAASSAPTNTCSPYNPCTTDSDCPSGQICDLAGCCKDSGGVITF